MVEEVFDKLKTLQDVLSRKFEVEKEIEEIPRVLATKIELLNRLKKTYIDKNRDLQGLVQRTKDLRTKAIEAEGVREKFEKQMDLIQTQREYEALDKEIRDAGEREQELRRSLQREEQLLEEMRTSLDKEELMIKKQEEEVAAEQSRIQGQIADKQGELDTLQGEEQGVTPGLDEELLFKFERIIRSKGGVGIVPIEQGVCTGCHMILSSQFVNDVRVGQSVRFCPNCSRVLYYGEETAWADEELEEDGDLEEEELEDEDEEEDEEGDEEEEAAPEE